MTIIKDFLISIVMNFFIIASVLLILKRCTSLKYNLSKKAENFFIVVGIFILIGSIIGIVGSIN